MTDEYYRELSNKIGTILDRITRLETILSERCARRASSLETIENRLRNLERQGAMLFGGLVLLGALLGFIWETFIPWSA